MGCILKGGGGLYSRVVVGAVLLAAGSGSRLGGRPKSLLELGGVPLIRRQLIALSGAGVDEVVVVLGHHADAIEASVRDFPVTLARNPSPDDGQASSVRIGLQALAGKLDAVIVALADQPMINAQDITALIGAFKKRGDASMVVPRVAGEPGNPVIFEAELREQWLAGDVDTACRRWRDVNPERVLWFDTDNQRYRVDIDTPEDIARFVERTGHGLRWPAALATTD
ncbi:nucleotidyltransferase family protein [Variovorax sp. PAMC28562]|uniref:nucleotidyltransferase family protein n=1 Tax=Variovorax sp. PAMC28562 TaxID=2762323 RepID=UPI00164EC9F0|nr:nucleotidyltransferase family protein [Variovorax sp. PAMC28562]QNK74649.1 nucleotidyltransferase family protein [Variovorax sp. PAMC28562]